MTQIIYKQVTIANGQTLSSEVDLEGSQLVGINIPAEFDGTSLGLTAAPILSDGTSGTFVDVQNGSTSSTALAFTTTASRYIPIDNLAMTAGLRKIKLKAATSQTGNTVFTLTLRQVA